MEDDAKDKERPVAQEIPAMTSKEFLDAADKLLDRARAAGVRPLQTFILTQLKKGVDMLDVLSTALDEGNDKNKKGKQ